MYIGDSDGNSAIAVTLIQTRNKTINNKTKQETMKKISVNKVFYSVAFSIYAIGCGICAYGSSDGAKLLGALFVAIALIAIYTYTKRYC